MGKGKGAPEYWAGIVNPGRILFEIDSEDLELEQKAMHLASQKPPIKAEFVVRRDYVRNEIQRDEVLIARRAHRKACC